MEPTTQVSYYILEGKRVVTASLMEWATFMEKKDARRIAFSKVGKAEVSTVFIGLNHQFGEGPPLLFETMVFGGKQDEHQRRFSTYDEAEQGHLEVVTMLKTGRAF